MISAPAPASMADPAPAAAPRLALAAGLFTVVSWASAFPLIRVALDELTPLQLASARFALAGGMAAAWLAWQGIRRPSAGEAGRFILCGLFGIALYNAFLNLGQRSVTPGAASFIVNTVPIITALLATMVLKQRIGRLGWIGSGVGLFGVGVIASSQPGGLGFGGGASFVLAAAFCQAVYFIVQRPLVARYGALTSTAVTLLVGGTLLLPWLPGAVRRAASGALSIDTMLAVVVLGVVPAALGYAAWSYAIRHYGPVRASNLLYLVPPVATILAVPLTGEAPGLPTVVGGLIAVAGVALVNARNRS